MAEDFDEFDDFDADIAKAAEAEVQEEQAQGEQEETELEPIQAPAPVVKKGPFGRPKIVPQVHTPAPAPARKAQAPTRQAAAGTKLPDTPRYTGYTTSQRYGVLDNQTGKTYAESESVERLILQLLVEIKNDLDEIKASI